MLPHSIYTVYRSRILAKWTFLSGAVACLFILFGWSFPADARFISPAKIPWDNFVLAEQIKRDVYLLQELEQREVLHQPLPPLDPKQPRHVYQKALEVLAKVNRYRQIKGMGEIVIPHYPARQITPDEVYGLVMHVRDEIRLLLPEPHRQLSVPSLAKRHVTPTEVYANLWQTSLAFDPLLGVRGFTPNDVYQQAEYIVQMIDFLRLSQNKALRLDKPEKTRGKHPNHALQAAYKLQNKIFLVQKNLWMPAPEKAPKVPRRVISPTDVYDALQVVIAELQRIKYRLGIDRELPLPPARKNKTPDDVIQLLTYAERLLPSFDLQGSLFQYDNAALEKTPNDTFIVASRILYALEALNKARGIRAKAAELELIQEIDPRHVLQITLQNLRMTDLLRRDMQLAATAIPHPPLREVTPTDVYQLMLRLEEELKLHFKRIHFSYPMVDLQEVEKKTPRDVYRKMWQIKEQLDLLTGQNLITTQDLWQEGVEIAQTLQSIYLHLNREFVTADDDKGENNGAGSGGTYQLNSTHSNQTNPQTNQNRQAGLDSTNTRQSFANEPHRLSNNSLSNISLLKGDIGSVMLQSRKLLQQVSEIKKRGGSFSPVPPDYFVVGDLNHADLYANLNLVHDELIALKPHLGIFRSDSSSRSLALLFAEGLKLELIQGLQTGDEHSEMQQVSLLLHELEQRLKFMLIPELP